MYIPTIPVVPYDQVDVFFFALMCVRKFNGDIYEKGLASSNECGLLETCSTDTLNVYLLIVSWSVRISAIWNEFKYFDIRKKCHMCVWV